jgi:hypothetical protein
LGKRGHVSLIEVTPGFESIRRAVARTVGKRSLTIVSSSNALQLRVQEAFVGDAEFADARASGTLDVVTVSQLVSKLCAAASVPTMPTLDLERQASLIGLVAQGLPNDSAFGSSKHLPGFYRAAAETLQELRHERVRIDSLAVPAGKLRDIAALQEGLNDELQRRSHCTLSDKIEALIGAPAVRLSEVSHVLWLPERDWPKLRLELLEWMVRSGIDVDLVTETHPTDDRLFRSGGLLRDKFSTAKVERIDADLTPGSRLFGDTPEMTTTGSLTLMQASDAFIEVEWALRECRRRIRNDGFDARDIVLFSRSLETYGPMLRAAADREDLPLAIDYSEPLKAHPFCRYVLQALNSMARSDIGGVVALVRSVYGQVPTEQRSNVEAAIRGLAREDDLWKSIGQEAKSGNLPDWLAAVANWRSIALGGQRKPADWMRGIEQLMASTPWLASSNPREEAARDAMVRSLNIGLLALDAHAGFSLAEFVEFADRTWSAADYRVRTQGGIRVVSDPFAIGNAKAVIAVGIIEGRFPSRRAEDPILLDRDRVALQEIDSAWKLADSYERAEDDDRDFYRLLCSCRDTSLCFPDSIGENPQDRAAYLWELKQFPGVSTETRTFSQRFPKPDDCLTDRDRVASFVWHCDPGPNPMPSTVERVKSLRAAHEQSQLADLKDDILRAKLGALPDPVRMAHLRSLAQCPFQYFARHKLGVRSKRGDPMNRVVVNAIRRSNFHAATEDEFRESLLNGLEAELMSLQGILDEHEMQVVRCAAPTTLDQFAKMEIKARQLWKVTPYQVAPDDDQTGLRRAATFGESKITLSPAIDVLYKRNGTDDLVPMRIGWEVDDEQSKMECHLVMMMHRGSTKYMMFDAYNYPRRTLFCRREDGRKEGLGSSGNLTIDVGSHLRDLQKSVSIRMNELLARARSGIPVVQPVPKHCARCDLGSFCRAAPYADPAVDWTAVIEEAPE